MLTVDLMLFTQRATYQKVVKIGVNYITETNKEYKDKNCNTPVYSNAEWKRALKHVYKQQIRIILKLVLTILEIYYE